MRGTLTVDAGCIGFEGAEEAWDKVWEVGFAKSFDECTEGLCSSRASFGDWVGEYNVDEGQERAEVRYEVFGVGQRRKIADDLSSFALRLRAALLKAALHDGDDLAGCQHAFPND